MGLAEPATAEQRLKCKLSSIVWDFRRLPLCKLGTHIPNPEGLSVEEVCVGPCEAKVPNVIFFVYTDNVLSKNIVCITEV